MDIYQRKSYWKWYLAAAGMLIVLISGYYTYYLAKNLTQEEINKANQLAAAIRSITESDPDVEIDACDLSLQREIIVSNTTIPIFLVDEAGNIEDFRNIGEDSTHILDDAAVKQLLVEMVASGKTKTLPVRNEHFDKKLIYSHSQLLNLLQLFPFVQFILIAAFIAFGYLGFSQSRRAEENQVWVGMAKETAHQLGTPITAIVGWIEHLQIMNEDNKPNLVMIEELRNDVVKLELIADRFSKIGSQPELEPVNVYEQLHGIKTYMQRRAPKRVAFHFPDHTNLEPLSVMMNQHLLDWVLENILRNAIDAMEQGEGTITCEVYSIGKTVSIDITDTGKGIPHNKFKTVFKPGYSTKKRGWGLGLSLSKRIVEEYHGGKIFVKKSEPGVATTFTIELTKGSLH
jgi:nitrogen-specific signal transduction histidine kinase